MPLFPPRHPRRAQAGLADKVVPQLKSELADKGKAKGNARAGAIRAVRALTEKFGAAAESVVVPLLGELLEALADKLKPVSIEAEKAIDALMATLSPHAVKAIRTDSLDARKSAEPSSRPPNLMTWPSCTSDSLDTFFPSTWVPNLLPPSPTFSVLPSEVT